DFQLKRDHALPCQAVQYVAIRDNAQGLLGMVDDYDRSDTSLVEHARNLSDFLVRPDGHYAPSLVGKDIDDSHRTLLLGHHADRASTILRRTISLIDCPHGEPRDKSINKEVVDNSDRHACHQARRHERSPIIDVSTHEVGRHTD